MKRKLQSLGLFLCAFVVAACSSSKDDSNSTDGAGGMSTVDAGGAGGAGGGTCESTCMPGLVRCSGDAIETCADVDRDGCYDWTAPVECAPGFACSNGVCTDPAACEDECIVGASQCGEIGVQACATDFDSDPCADWGPAVPCRVGESCSNGACSPGPCEDECGEDARRCAGPGFQVCGQFDADECLEWSPSIDCGQDLTCSNGECTSPNECTDECVDGNTQCVDGNSASAVCGQFDGDDCLELGEQTRCRDGEICANGVCGPPEQCQSECVADERRCQGNGYQVCRELDESCLVFGEPQPCEPGMGCVYGVCVDGAIDECPGLDAVRCDGDSVRTCGQFDADPALDWSAPQPCPMGQTCSLGQCSDVCVDECELDAVDCRYGGVLTCGQHDGDACADWGAFTPCGIGQACSRGACVPVGDCQDECEIIGETVCGRGGIRQCGDYDADECLEYSSAIACLDGQVCDAGACVDEQDPGQNDNASLEIFAPGEGETLSGDLYELRINAVDPDGIERLVVQIGEVVVAEAAGGELPGGWLTTRIDTRGLPDGLTTLTATVTDIGGRSLESIRNIRIDNSGPVIEITSPAAGRVLGGEFDFSATLSDASGITSYGFLVGLDPVEEVLVVPGTPDNLQPTVTVNAADFPEGPIDLTVFATDRFGYRTELTHPVEFRTGLILESESPVIIGGRFPTVAEPFNWRVSAQAPAGVAQVEFLVDGVSIAVDNEAPYEAFIDPLVYAERDSLCPPNQHELSVILTDANQQTERGSWCASWDTGLPEIELLRPAEAGGLLVREGDDYVVEVNVVDEDTSPSVTVLLDGVVVGRQDEPPYAVRLAANDLLADLENHSREMTVEVQATDYLGNQDQLIVPFSVSRGDWAVRQLTFQGRLALKLDNDEALFGTWSARRQQGYLTMLGQAGSGEPRWELELRRGWMPVEAFQYAGNSGVGIRCDIPATGDSGFVRVDPDGRVTYFDIGFVDKAIAATGLSTFLQLAPSRVTRMDIGGELVFTFDTSVLMQPQNVQDIWSLPGGDVLVHSFEVEDETRHKLHRVSRDGVLLWTHEIDGGFDQGHVDVSGSVILYSRNVPFGDGFQAQIHRVDAQTGEQLWSWVGEEDPLITRIRSLFAPTGQYLWLYTGSGFMTHLLAFNVDTGRQEYREPPVSNFRSGFSPADHNISSVMPLLPEGDMLILGERTGPILAGMASSVLWRVRPDGGVPDAYYSSPAVEIEGQIVAPVFSPVATSGGHVVAASSTVNGQSWLAGLDSELALAWTMTMPDNNEVVEVRMVNQDTLDVVSQVAGVGEAVYPVQRDGNRGTYPWRVHRPDAEVSGVVGTDTTLFVLLNDDDGVEIVRIPRD
ncbi:MAG: Ig-like domain-containing protein [Bradymonadia bacterium]